MLLTETDDNTRSCHFRSIMTGPELTICTTVVKFDISHAFWIFVKTMFHLKSKMLALP